MIKLKNDQDYILAIMNELLDRDYSGVDMEDVDEILDIIKVIGPKWISVKERLPVPGQDVLVWVEDDFNCFDIARHSGDSEGFCNGWDTNSDLCKYRSISHWMPLPPQPR